MTYRPPATMLQISLRLAAGGWVHVCRANAELLRQQAHLEVQHKPFATHRWQPMDASYSYRPRHLFRVRSH